MNSNYNYRIFIADDDAFSLAMYERHLLNLNFTSVSCFAYGKELLENLYQSPDLIFLDYNLEDSNGLDLLMKIKESDPEIFVVIISGQPDMEITINLLNHGVFDYIIKNDSEEQNISVVIGKWLAACEEKKRLASAGNVNISEKYIKTIVEAQEKVRREISSELHDNVSQLLGASKLYIEMACQDEIDRLSLLNESKSILNSAITEIRKLSHSLQSVLIHSSDLEDELHKIFSGLEKQKKFNLDYSVSISEIKDQLPTNTQHNIVRIIQEQLNNIIKYSQAKNVNIAIGYNRDELSIKISDDGIGFKLNIAKRGIGLNNIFSRVANLNGTCTIKTAPGEGCNWNITIPLAETHQNSLNSTKNQVLAK